MPINDPHPEYEAMTSRWKRCRDVAAGSDAVKAAGTRYLPRPPGMDHFDGSYRAYLARTLFFNAMSRTIDGLAGAIFQKSPTVVVPKTVEPSLADISLSDESLDGFALRVTREVLTTGRCAVLVDVASAETNNGPYMALYPAESLVSWRTGGRGGSSVLVRAVLHVVIDEPDAKDESKISRRDMYRELVLSDNVYRVRLWTSLPRLHVRDTSKEIWVSGDWMTPQRRGKPLSFIPLLIIGANRLGAHVARPPLVDLADVNLSHYRSSADREAALYFVSMPTPWVSGAKGDGPLKIGASVAWDLEKDGRAGMLEHSGQGIGAIKDAMQEKTAMMATLGARLLEEAPRVGETATAVTMRHAGEHATLRTIAQTVEAGLSQALGWFAWWVGTEKTPADVGASIELNKDFLNVRMSAEDMKALMLMWQTDGISFETLHYNLTQGEAMRPGVTADDERRQIGREG